MTAIGRNAFPAELAIEARRLRDAGWGLNSIHSILTRRATSPEMTPSRATVYRWIADTSKLAARERRRTVAQHKGDYRWPGLRGTDWRMGRIRALDQAGLTAPAIATVMTHDFPDMPLAAGQVRRSLITGSLPRPYSRKENTDA